MEIAELRGTVFDIQRFSLHDGPGIRTNVFLKGCPLRCIWCHNPEGLRHIPQIMFTSRDCIACGECAVCPEGAHIFRDGLHGFDRSKCLSETGDGACGKCAEVCPAEALRIAGKRMTVDEVLKTVLDDVGFYSDGGGMTLSGGEPFFQPEFALALLKAAKEKGINTAVETSGFASETAFRAALQYIDLLLFDCKLTNDEDHKKYTGVPLEPIRRNLAAASETGTAVTLRCPIIPGINDTEEHIRGVAALGKTVKSLREIHLEPYHSLGSSKSEQLGEKPAFLTSPPEKEHLESLLKLLQSLSDVNVRISK